MVVRTAVVPAVLSVAVAVAVVAVPVGFGQAGAAGPPLAACFAPFRLLP